MSKIRCEMSQPVVVVKIKIHLPEGEFHSLKEWTELTMLALLRQLRTPGEWEATERHATKLKAAIRATLENEFANAVKVEEVSR